MATQPHEDCREDWAIVEGNELPQGTGAWASLLETKIGQEWPFWASLCAFVWTLRY